MVWSLTPASFSWFRREMPSWRRSDWGFGSLGRPMRVIWVGEEGFRWVIEAREGGFRRSGRALHIQPEELAERHLEHPWILIIL